MKYLSLFDNFNQVEESYNFDNDSLIESKVNQMSMLREGCMAAWDFNEFSNFFGPTLNENNTEEENNFLMEKAYYTYELGVLYEHNQDWFEGGSNIIYLEDNSTYEGYSILFKNNRLHIIKESTLSKLKEGIELIEESLWGWVKDTVKSAAGAVNKYVIQPVKKAAAYVGKKVGQAWDALSNGAKKVWEFSKKILSMVAAFAKENPLTCIGLVLTIIGTILSFIPVAQFLSPILATIAGGITVYEGARDLIKSSKAIGKAEKVGEIVKGGGKIIFGSASLLLGIRDLIASASEALPGMGAIGIGIKSAVVGWTNKFTATAFGAVASAGAGKAIGCSAWLGEFFVTLCEKAPFVKNAINKFPKIAKHSKTIAGVVDKGADQGKSAVLDSYDYNEESEYQNWDGNINEQEGGGWGFGELLINFLVYVGKSCFGWLYDIIVKGISGIGKVINGLMDLPGKITRGIDKFKKDQGSSFIGGIISGALSTAVRPITSVAQKFIDTYIKPTVKPLTGWMTSLGKRNASISKAIEGNKSLKSPVGGIKKADPPKIEKQEVVITAKDKAALKKIGNKGVSTMVKAGGGTQKMVEKIKKAQDEFKKKFPGVSKEKGSWGSSPSGKATYTIKSKEAGGSVTLFNDGKYTVASGPNKKARGEFKADKGVKLMEPKDGWKKNESRNYILSIDSFLG